KYSANDAVPGLTGLAQITGRDELEIDTKAMRDGQYVALLHKSCWSGFKTDVKLFFGTIFSVLREEGVVEGGTGQIVKMMEESNVK
ncbi:sugar transferase, partial [Vibrio sp. FNV 38]|nr:sugar transferase [Vibrio sp. FNV 38]